MDGEAVGTGMGIGGIVTVIIGAIVAAYVKMRKASDESQAAIDKRTISGYELAIAEFKAMVAEAKKERTEQITQLRAEHLTQLSEMRTEMAKLRQDHQSCEYKLAECNRRISSQQQEIEGLKQALAEHERLGHKIP